MGRWYQTNFARLMDGTKVSVYDALEMLRNNNKLRGSFQHITLDNVPVKFVPSSNGSKEDYFAIINKGIISERDKLSLYEHPLHKLAKDMLVNPSKYGINSIVFDSIVVPIDRIKSASSEVRLYDVSDDDSDYIIPDVTLETNNFTYYIEIYNTNKVDRKKVERYRYRYNNFSKDFKVIEIDISDFVAGSSLLSYTELEKLLNLRLTTNSDRKSIIDLSSTKILKKFSPFGKCHWCGEPLQLLNNIGDPIHSSKVDKEDPSRGLKYFKTCDIQDSSRKADGDKTSCGSAILYCPKCTEGRFTQAVCPKCLHTYGKLVPLTLIYNDVAGGKKGVFALKCQHYLSDKDARIQLQKGIFDVENTCDFCIGVLESDMITPSEEIYEAGGLENLYKSYKSSMKNIIKTRAKHKKN